MLQQQIPKNFYPSVLSPNFDDRKNEVPYICMVILHYTVLDFEKTVATFSSPTSNVSSNYIINTDGVIYICVPEEKRAWHAGFSSFGGIGYNLNTKTRVNGDINSCSIGIEIVNPGYDKTQSTIVPYTQEQILSVRVLVSNIVKKYNIAPKFVLGHSDIAPNRKFDPGIHFPWHQITNPKTNIPLTNILSDGLIAKQDPSLLPSDKEISNAFQLYGYNIDNLDNTKKTFQEHYNTSAWVNNKAFGDDDKKRLLALLELDKNKIN